MGQWHLQLQWLSPYTCNYSLILVTPYQTLIVNNPALSSRLTPACPTQC